MTSQGGKAESTCPQNQPNLAQTLAPGSDGLQNRHLSLFQHPAWKSAGGLRSTPAHVTFTPRRQRSPLPTPSAARNPALASGGSKLVPFQQNLHKSMCSSPPIPKAQRLGAEKLERAASWKTQVTEQTQNCPLAAQPTDVPHRAGISAPGVGWVSPSTFTGARKPNTLGLGDYSTRGAQATRALELTRSGEGDFWRRRRKDVGPRT